jgi:RNA polymerase sigma-70 factor (ECF subfamily)
LSYGEIAQAVGRGEPACRQLVSRAREHIRQRAPRFSSDRSQHADAVRAFRTACVDGSVQGLVRVLDPDVILRSDGGGRVPRVARRPVVGVEKVVRLLLGVAARNPAIPRTVTVNGSTGLLFDVGGAVAGLMGFTVAGGRITEIDFVVNPDKLTRITLDTDFGLWGDGMAPF